MYRPALSSLVLAGLALACGSSDSGQAAAVDNWPGEAPGPAGQGMGVRLMGGAVATLSAGTACTSQADAGAERWCAFLSLSETGDHNLFVINVSQVIDGVSVSCDGTDPNCLFLVDHVEGDTEHPTRFSGETLIYYDRELTAFAWRPGMAEGRVLARREHTRDISYCTAARRGPAIACLSTPFEQPAGLTVIGQIFAGSIEGESEPLLAPISDVIAASPPDNAMVHRFGFSALADGYVAWSGRETPDGPEVLKLAQVDDPESQITVASDVHAWVVSDDGSSWLWLRSINELGVGNLETASFPDGGDPTLVLDKVFYYGMNRDDSVVAMTESRDVFSFIDPIGAPEQKVLIDSGVGTVISVSDQGHVAFAKSTVGGVYNLFAVSRLDGTRSCVLETNGGVSLGAVHFSPASQSVLWARKNSTQFDAFHSRLGDCMTVPFSPDVRVIGWVGGHAVFIDDFDAANNSGSLRFRRIGRDGEIQPDEPTLIAEQVDTYLSWARDFVLYTVSDETDADGIYVRAFGR